MIKYATIDIESTGLSRYNNKITYIGVGLSSEISTDLSLGFDKYFKYESPFEGKTFMRLQGLISNLRKRKIQLIWQNGKFDTLFIEHELGLKLPVVHDVMVMGTAYDLAATHGLKDMAQRYLDVENWDISKKSKTNKSKDTEQYLYFDVLYTWKLFCFFMSRMNEQQMKVYKELLLPAYKAYRNIERNGIYFDQKKYEEVKKLYKEKADSALRELKSRYDINWNSPAQVSKALFEAAKLPTIKLSQKTGTPSADAKVLKRLSAKGHELPKLLLDYKFYYGANTKFLNQWGKYAEYDGHIHPNFGLTNVVTGRTSCLSAYSLVMTITEDKPIKDIKIGDYVYSYDDNLKPVIRQVIWSGKTGMKPLYRIYYKSTGKHKELYLDVTGNHLVRLTSGEYKRVDQLVGHTNPINGNGDKVLAIHRAIDKDRKILYVTGIKEKLLEHVLIFEQFNGYIPEHVHHKDRNPLNNEPSNLKGMTRKAHTKLHATQINPNSKEHFSKIAKDNWDNNREHMLETVRIRAKRKFESAITKEALIEALRIGNGVVGAARYLGRDYEFVKNRMIAWGIAYDGRKRKPNNHYITRIEKLQGIHDVYDLTVEETHNFIANEICVHNCSEPNLQQVPRNPELRSLFTAKPGRVLLEADYSQIELRIAADYANERNMINIYRTGGDIHTETAKLITGKSEITKEDRTRAKGTNFGYLYGMGWKSFVDYAFDNYGIVVTNDEAKRFRELFFMKFPGLVLWHKNMELECELLGGVSNRFGRFRALPNIYSSDFGERNSAVRRAINTPVQGTASDLLIASATQIDKELRRELDVRVVGTVHDSILVDAPEKYAETVKSEMIRIMVHPYILDTFNVKFKIPIEVDVGIGAWGSK